MIMGGWTRNGENEGGTGTSALRAAVERARARRAVGRKRIVAESVVQVNGV